MAWYPAARRYSTPYVGGTYDPVAVVAHRTYGVNSHSIGIGQGGRRVSFHFLVCRGAGGSVDGEVRQYLDTRRIAWHAKGANDWAIGVEVESRSNSDPMTRAQRTAVGDLLDWINEVHGIPLQYDPGPVRKGRRPGVIAHAAVAGSDHGDLWTTDEWSSISGRFGPRPGATVTVPNFVGVLEDQVDQVVGGRLVIIRQRIPRGLTTGRVYLQQPAAGTTVPAGSAVTVTVDQGEPVQVAKYGHDGFVHSFDIDGGTLWHRWYDGKRWNSEPVAGPRAAGATMSREPVAALPPAAFELDGLLHCFVGRLQAWYDPKAAVWSSKVLP